MSSSILSRTLGKDDLFVLRTLDGSDTLYTREFGTSYHSINGAVSESRHVFIQHGLGRLFHLPEIHILEIGFGTGLNAFLAFLISKKIKKTIFYSGIEAYPIDHLIAGSLNYPSYLAAEDYKDVFLKMHQEDFFTAEYFHFHKHPSWKGSAHSFDCIFFDAFAPDEQPAMWEQKIFDQLYNVTSPGGYLVTYCAKGEVRRKMERAGYHVKRIPGAPGKRQMIQALKMNP